jgi:hypothetical protein
MDLKILRENIFRLLEEETKFNEGDTVTTQKDGDGIIQLSKHPYYSIKLNTTGITKSYHFTDLVASEPIESEFGKYELNESPSDKIIKLDGILSVDEDIFLTDVLSDIRSLSGITTVRNIDIENEDLKSKLNIKIDPYPFGDSGEEKIKSFLIKKIKQIPGVRDFHKVKHVEKLSNNQKLRLPTSSPIPVSSMDKLKEIKIQLKLKK